MRAHLVAISLSITVLTVLTACPPDELSEAFLRYGKWYRPPRTPREAKAIGYRRVNEICQMDTYHGFLYVQRHNDKSRLLFDHNDKLAGIQTAIPGNMFGFNSLNESLQMPSKEIIPPILLSQEHYSSGVQMYTVTAYFKHPSLICSPYNQHAHPGKGLYIQMGYQVERQYEKIPLDASHLSSEWKTGTCLHSMGRHYFKHLSRDMKCESLYPVYLMYNAEGQLGGFGWLFQGAPTESRRTPVRWLQLDPSLYPASFDTSMLPPCMFNPNFKIFTIRIYLRNEHTMICPRNGDKQEGRRDHEGHGHHGGRGHHHDRTNANNEEVTFRPLHPKPTNASGGSGGGSNTRTPKYINSQTNNVIVDDAMRERDGPRNVGVSAVQLSSRSVFICSVLVSTLVCLALENLLSSTSRGAAWDFRPPTSRGVLLRSDRR
ncbi:hypothetical protein ElyMa_001766200 [Elysia marginata]|uniref:Uncharacterized protein n=1 Tax=Elysia marginata TaxID=1093978 RepID=A0AAV4ECP4_9GAST|nr:hypothetical protein ElyMa_001766200 [Elysia marginata]